METRGPNFPRAAAAGEGFAERTSGPSSPLPLPSRAASGRALRGGGSRCEGCMRPAGGPALSSRRGLRCLCRFFSFICIDSSVDHDGYSISSKGFLPTVVDIIVTISLFSTSVTISIL